MYKKNIQLTDDMLIEAYYKSVEFGLKNEFVIILIEEMKDRNLDPIHPHPNESNDNWLS